MLTILIALCIGIGIGYALKKRPAVIHAADICAKWLVCLLLLSLGLSIGGNASILDQFKVIGVATLFICIGSTAGSAVAGWGMFKLFFKKDQAADRLRQTADGAGRTERNSGAAVSSAAKGALKNCALILLMFIIGVGIGLSNAKILKSIPENSPEIILHVLLLMVGVGIGRAPQTWRSVGSMGLKIFLVPLAAIIGSLAGAVIISPLIPGFSIPHILAVASGFGYYSLASIIISAKGLSVLGTISLLCNLLRELSAIMLIPIILRVFGPLGTISAAGATSMDTALPFIAQQTSSKYAILAIINGTVLTLVVPFLVPLVLSL